jgi:SOS-response transcriptional repressor LexA
VRLEPDHQTTFKRIYFEQDSIRLQPLNSAFPPRILPRDQVAGLYAAVAVIKKLP